MARDSSAYQDDVFGEERLEGEQLKSSLEDSGQGPTLYSPSSLLSSRGCSEVSDEALTHRNLGLPRWPNAMLDVRRKKIEGIHASSVTAESTYNIFSFKSQVNGRLIPLVVSVYFHLIHLHTVTPPPRQNTALCIWHLSGENVGTI